MKYVLSSLILSALFAFSYAQDCTYKGRVVDASGNALESVNVYAQSNPTLGSITDDQGRFEFKSSEKQLTLVFSHLSFHTVVQQVSCNQSLGSFVLYSNAKALPQINIEDNAIEKLPEMQEIDAKKFKALPTASGSFESLLFSQAGVSSRNEMSAQYSVRGGNFDENLIYVNDIEIYRPFLVRSGQQEGLSFINPDMVESVYFSAGGFAAQYGDKISSVLDVTYKEVDSSAGAISMSLLGAQFYIADKSKNHKFTQSHALRYRTNRYLLGALETDGSFAPNFLDYQSFLTYQPIEDFKFSLLINVATNAYNFKPQSRQTDFGTIQQALRLSVFYEGEEQNKFDTYTAAFSAEKQFDRSKLKYISSFFHSNEREFYDVLGLYRLSELEADLGSEDFGNETFTLGVGGFLDHARNTFNASVFTNKLLFLKTMPKQSELKIGVQHNFEIIDDVYKEWNLIDSSGYSLVHPQDSVGYTSPELQAYPDFEIDQSIRSNNKLNSHRFSGFVQHSKWFELFDKKIHSNLGVRSNYWTVNKEVLVSPRLTFSTLRDSAQMTYRLSMGLYNQPAFYRELRRLDGSLNLNVKAQQTFQIVAGISKGFSMWNRPFIFNSEAYYKYGWNVLPYFVENVRIRYYPDLIARSKTTGIDFKLNGEFVKGIDSWLSLSLLSAKEDIQGDDYLVYYNDNNEIIRPFTVDQQVVDSQLVSPGFIPRPTDQRLNIGLFFQDYLPGNPKFKVHLNMLYGTRIPYGELLFRTRDTLQVPPYRRVDIGFSALLKDAQSKNIGAFKHFNNIWLTLEVFNLFEINNTISYLWIKDISNNRWAIPNFLTSRRINLRLRFEF